MASLRDGAEAIVHEFMDVQPDEFVAIVNDGNDPALMHALIDVIQDVTEQYVYVRYPEPEHHSTEPPDYVANILQTCDVGIAPTTKSISHTQARLNARNKGARIATLPGVTQEVWTTSLLADPDEVTRITEHVVDLMKDVDKIHVETGAGTDLEIKTDIRYRVADLGSISEPGSIGNLPPGEVGTGVLDANGTLVVEDFYIEPGTPGAPRGTEIVIENREAVNIEHPEKEMSPLKHVFQEIPRATNVAEFGIGTNPEATIINNVLNDEKVLGTVHVAFGDSSTFLPDEIAASVESDVHWDIVLENPTVHFDDTLVLDEGEPVFLNA